MLCFEKQGGTSVIDPNTYLYYIQARPSNSRENRWIPYDDTLEETLVGDFRRLWATSFLDDLAVDVRDVRYANGVPGKLAIFNMEERQRVKIVDYVGSERVSHSDIDEKLKEKGISIRLDSFIDPGTVRQVAGVVRELYAEKGYQYAEVKPSIKEVTGGPKTIHLSFNITEGPKVRINDIDFLGNQAVSDSTLGRKMKENKGRGFFGFITGGGTFKEDKFAEDADKVVEYLPRRGLHHCPGRPAGAEDPGGLGRRVKPLRPASGSGDRRQAIQGRQLHVRGEHDREGRVSSAALQARRRRVPIARSTFARASRKPGKSTAPAATTSSPRIPISSRATCRPCPRTARSLRPDLHPRTPSRTVHPSSTSPCG